ncbi:hypothetical protein PMAL9190_00925 [Photobacterium malacitanum]|uniref:Uncharacterized protein n=1 Tax=Photobacterium malacitanum TaxID=2204294 RepID=A0A1Y6MDC0_9GAMM|nr:hypothetical protein PMAL9190_00925 [Photobacterium malacitanum]
MASGEWRVASGEWRVASGEWRVASGEKSLIANNIVAIFPTEFRYRKLEPRTSKPQTLETQILELSKTRKLENSKTRKLKLSNLPTLTLILIYK